MRLADVFHAPLRGVHADTTARWRDIGDTQRVAHSTAFGESVELDDVAGTDAATGIARGLGDDESSRSRVLLRRADVPS